MRFRFGLRIRWPFHPFQDGPQSYFHSPNERLLRQISPDKNVNFCYTASAFTLSSESWALLCCANLPEDWAFRLRSSSYCGTSICFSQTRRFYNEEGLQTFPHGNALRSKSGIFGLPSANTFVNVLNTLTGFTHRRLAPHKFTPIPCVHKRLKLT